MHFDFLLVLVKNLPPNPSISIQQHQHQLNQVHQIHQATLNQQQQLHALDVLDIVRMVINDLINQI
jgi:hypothetical protein